MSWGRLRGTFSGRPEDQYFPAGISVILPVAIATGVPMTVANKETEPQLVAPNKSIKVLSAYSSIFSFLLSFKKQQQY